MPPHGLYSPRRRHYRHIIPNRSQDGNPASAYPEPPGRGHPIGIHTIAASNQCPFTTSVTPVCALWRRSAPDQDPRQQPRKNLLDSGESFGIIHPWQRGGSQTALRYPRLWKLCGNVLRSRSGSIHNYLQLSRPLKAPKTRILGPFAAFPCLCAGRFALDSDVLFRSFDGIFSVFGKFASSRRYLCRM